ncbi:MAG TPA: hypothetical protein VIS29_16925 [Streptomyces sp.]
MRRLKSNVTNPDGTPRFRTAREGEIWANPDCGLKTRGWPEVRASLEHPVAATREIRSTLPSLPPTS